MRSSTPPWPGIIVRAVLHTGPALQTDSNRSPTMPNVASALAHSAPTGAVTPGHAHRPDATHQRR